MSHDIKNDIILISGSFPPDVCGVGDYTKVLYNSVLKKQPRNLNYILFCKRNWSLKFLFQYLKEIKSYRAKIVHMQYPTEGYGYSFLPFFLMALLPVSQKILTLHELSNRTSKARLFSYLLAITCDVIIVTNDFEAKYLKRKWFFSHKKIFVIHIGSNIPESAHSSNNFSGRKKDLVYFGHIRPLKGLEKFFTIVDHLKRDGTNINCAVIGQSMQRYQDYFDAIKKQADALGVELILNKSDTLTAIELADSKIVYLPFPDGVSLRRGSFMAAILNNCAVITTPGKDFNSNNFFDKYCYLAENQDQVISEIREILSNPDNRKSVEALKSYFSWDNVVEEHIQLYNRCLI